MPRLSADSILEGHAAQSKAARRAPTCSRHVLIPALFGLVASVLVLCGEAAAQNQPPVADAGEDQTVFLGEVAQLDGSASFDPDNDPIVAWMWDFESAPPGSATTLNNRFGVNPSFQPDVLGEYVVSLVVNDGLLWSVSDTVSVSVIENLPPVSRISAHPTVGGVPLTVGFDGSASFDPEDTDLSYTWSFGDGSMPTTGVTVTHVYTSVGVYDATLAVVDGFGLVDSETLQIAVLPRSITRTATDSGRYSSTGFHYPDDTDYEAVVDGSRSFFVFDLTSLTDPRRIVAATLKLDTGGVTGGAFGGITYTLYEVSAPVATLREGGDGLIAIYDDLGSGVPYSAETEIAPEDAGSEKSIPLLPAGVAAVSAARGGLLAIGGGPTGRGGNSAFSGTDVSGAELVIEFWKPSVPALPPAALGVLASLLLLAGFGVLRRLRVRGR